MNEGYCEIFVLIIMYVLLILVIHDHVGLDKLIYRFHIVNCIIVLVFYCSIKHVFKTSEEDS